MKVSDIMTYTPLTCSEDDTLRQITEKMVMRGCGSIPVVDGELKLKGIVTIRDTMLPLYPNFGEYVHDAVHARDFESMEENYKKVLCMKVKEVMTENPMSIEADTPILKAASFMGVKNLRRMPVTKDDQLIGMVSIGDIARGLYIHQGI